MRPCLVEGLVEHQQAERIRRVGDDTARRYPTRIVHHMIGGGGPRDAPVPSYDACGTWHPASVMGHSRHMTQYGCHNPAW